MQKLDFIATDKAPAAVGPYSQAVRAGGFVYVSGQLGMVPATGQFAGADFEAQARQALSNMGAILAEAGCSTTDIVSVDVFVTDLANFKLFNGIYDEFMAGHRPARAAVQVSALPLGGIVEIKCVALARS
ncbi:Rid family detoxifying hydrolase [Desulfomicrobium baculatum]|uniref:Endoribonuclease L-PSP n=1 Tax=Desulfomicrobium baculatum (strain DSM 4028 / VKM B-1378 / X) TaxID=525897 RepID=C7LVV9_DESBD|nr:Rid family detoxifying hydrolase [Desulfomicrobium baculatum]ACU88588.1 endoribonuclease L-PSP [Desulfomicrobium baculatum DSM 4028]